MAARSSSDDLECVLGMFMTVDCFGFQPSPTGLDLDLPWMPRGDATLGIELCDKEAVDHVAEGGGHFEGVLLCRLEGP